jgi:hypothetical protein
VQIKVLMNFARPLKARAILAAKRAAAKAEREAA